MPIRSCILCKNKYEKANLLRIVADSCGNAILDKKQKINSRSIYICNNKECLERCLKAISKNKLKVKISINSDSLKKVVENILELGG